MTEVPDDFGRQPTRRRVPFRAAASSALAPEALTASPGAAAPVPAGSPAPAPTTPTPGR
ncbi:hypothetical protein [Streptomyces sp. enrichment culture]|uniref:hypothetical protein n=1 Tax=Streptomyces sp. enrichment culture TaxID=1795815 RepID=UPI003F54D838